jgi:phytoene synthase
MQTPSADRLPPLREADMAACRSLLKTGSRSFHAASRLLPYRCRDSATALYAFCRLADDAVDDSGAPHLALAMLHARLDAIYAGEPEDYAADRALAAVVVRCGLPRTLLDALLEGFAWDADGREYDSLSEVLDYAARVAGSVGVMMAVIMGIRDAGVLARAADMGVAMQLTNICRDVGEDARNDRLYLPRDWLREAGLDPEALRARPAHSAALAEIIRRLLVVAEALYRRADAGLVFLPAGCRPGMYAARLLYSAIGDEVLRQGGDSISRRAVVSAPRKLSRLGRLGGLPFLSGDAVTEPVLKENRFLVEAVNSHPGPRVSSLVETEGKVAWMLALFQDLERRERPGGRNSETREGASAGGRA